MSFSLKRPQTKIYDIFAAICDHITSSGATFMAKSIVVLTFSIVICKAKKQNSGKMWKMITTTKKE